MSYGGAKGKQAEKVIVFWFRRDLRLEDHASLKAATDFASQNSAKVLALFIFDKDILSNLEDKDDPRVSFIHDALEKVREGLREYGSDLLVEYGRPKDIWKKILSENDVIAAFATEDYEPYAIKRDEEIKKLVDLHLVKDQVIFAKLEVEKGTGGPYTVFTPYSKKWRAQLTPQDLKKQTPDFDRLLKFKSKGVLSLEEIGFRRTEIKLPEPNISPAVLKKYADTRNTPSVLGTSRIGVHLRFGTISIREMVKLAQKTSETWLSELIWREFFMQVLSNFPHVTEGPFRPEYRTVPFRHDKKEFDRWCQGKTGYPIVDAGMRELNETGFMHNRVRMIAASFLVKHLLIDWQWGEAYFARKLLDFELASNNGNWQWTAGTGCDAAPYFRVFNPETQAKKFDPQKLYIKTWVPEFGSSKYPEPMVDHVTARVRALRAYQSRLAKPK